jgi:hypothetical protein
VILALRPGYASLNGEGQDGYKTDDMLSHFPISKPPSSLQPSQVIRLYSIAMQLRFTSFFVLVTALLNAAEVQKREPEPCKTCSQCARFGLCTRDYSEVSVRDGSVRLFADLLPDVSDPDEGHDRGPLGQAGNDRSRTLRFHPGVPSCFSRSPLVSQNKREPEPCKTCVACYCFGLCSRDLTESQISDVVSGAFQKRGGC